MLTGSSGTGFPPLSTSSGSTALQQQVFGSGSEGLDHRLDPQPHSFHNGPQHPVCWVHQDHNTQCAGSIRTTNTQCAGSFRIYPLGVHSVPGPSGSTLEDPAHRPSAEWTSGLLTLSLTYVYLTGSSSVVMDTKRQQTGQEMDVRAVKEPRVDRRHTRVRQEVM